MSDDRRWVVVGVTRAREQWASDLTRWSTGGAAPLEFVKCLTADEARAVLGSGRRASALLVDARGPGVDRDLLQGAADAGVAPIVVSDGSVHRDWEALGCAAVLDHRFDLPRLLEVLGRHSAPVDRSRRPGRARLGASGGPPRGRVVTVLGSGGVGTSTVAMALAQGLASGDRQDPTAPSVVLVDGSARADLAMYHASGDVVPGLPELVEAHRGDRLDPEDVVAMTFEVPSRHYQLLLGRRRVADWVAARRRSVEAALDALRRSFDVVVVAVDADLDDMAATGSADVEDRHALNLAAVAACDLVLAVGRNGLHGVHGLVGVVEDLRGAGMPMHRVLTVVCDAPRGPAARATVAAAVARLTAMPDEPPLHPALILRSVKGLDDLHDRVAPLPPGLVDPVSRTVRRMLAEVGGRPSPSNALAVRPGELATDVDDALLLIDREGVA